MRFRRISGKGSKPEIEALLELDVESSIDIECAIGTAAVNSVALRQQNVMESFKMGAIDQRAFNTLMEWGSVTGEDEDDRRIQESCAHLENIEIEKAIAMMPPPMMGMPPMPGAPPMMPPMPMAPPAAPGAPPMMGPPPVPGHEIMPASDDHLVHYLAHRRAAVEAKLEGNRPLAMALEQAAAQHFAMMQPPAPPAGSVDSGASGVDTKPPA
jgi:hypothetical protein